MNTYQRIICGAAPVGDFTDPAHLVVDVYDVLVAFDVRCPALQHAIKKLLMPGQRGAKSRERDLREAMASVERALEMGGRS